MATPITIELTTYGGLVNKSKVLKPQDYIVGVG